uniref:Uncharacterized protein n=1 Tax=Anguilla anguilla TaxID=7936 RepID=A0A0E9S5G9_ANGAN
MQYQKQSPCLGPPARFLWAAQKLPLETWLTILAYCC